MWLYLGKLGKLYDNGNLVIDKFLNVSSRTNSRTKLQASCCSDINISAGEQFCCLWMTILFANQTNNLKRAPQHKADSTRCKSLILPQAQALSAYQTWAMTWGSQWDSKCVHGHCQRVALSSSLLRQCDLKEKQVLNQYSSQRIGRHTCQGYQTIQ